jgi:hypothetical protein
MVPLEIGTDFNPFDVGSYLYGMFFAGAFIMGGYAVAAGLTKIHNFKAPIAAVVFTFVYMWWTGESFDFLWDMVPWDMF